MPHNAAILGEEHLASEADPEAQRQAFWRRKRLTDCAISIVCLPALAVLGLAIVLANPFANRGPLLFTQIRMGRDCRPFRLYKFRTMVAGDVRRGPEDPVEVGRITPLGRFLRRTRLDETPQLVNVLIGDMALVGPRPDVYEHGLHFIETVPRYRRRYAVRPGITGFAQTSLGYVEGSDLTAKKVRKDITYIRRASWRFDLAIMLRTMSVMLHGLGAR
jgi:lipopolysaccharide/colanic/teichoic acid biosynthesis glycosyltransferase